MYLLKGFIFRGGLSDLDIKEWLKDLTKSLNDSLSENRFPKETNYPDYPNTIFDENEKMWGDPLVGFSSGNDQIYKFIKNDIGKFYRIPVEMFESKYEKGVTTSERLSVMSFVLPQTNNTLIDSRKEDKYPSARWVLTRTKGDDYLRFLTGKIVDELNKKNILAIAPMLSPEFERIESTKYGLCSNWSERHTAYICGLGTFGLCDGLITPLGKAMRCSSIIIEAQIEPDIRPYKTHRDYCLFFTNGTCGKCIKRCPANAISKNGHDKENCRRYQTEIIFPHLKRVLGFEPQGCGLCQTDVPCEHKIP